MKKIISIFTISAFIVLFILNSNSYAASLDNVSAEIDKQIVKPAEEVNLKIQFGENLGAYTFKIAYDNNIFEYVGAEGGTANDTQDKIIVTYYDQTGGTSPRANMNVTFRAKSGITTSNPTEFMITAEGLANADASVTYDDITVPIVKNTTVEPEYVDYSFKLEHTGEIIKNEEKQMSLSYFSSMGRYYEHAKLKAEVTAPQGANVKLLATDIAGLEQDIIESGFGDAQGYKIGGKDISQNLQTRAIFSNAGDYTITLKLIDRDNSDTVIAQKSFNFTVKEATEQITPPANNEDKTQENNETKTTENTEKVNVQNKTEEVKKNEIPTKLPKTGNNIYIPIIMFLVLLFSLYVYYNKKK